MRLRPLRLVSVTRRRRELLWGQPFVLFWPALAPCTGCETAAPRPKPGRDPIGPFDPGQRSHRRAGLDERAPFKISAPSYACELVVGPEASPEYT